MVTSLVTGGTGFIGRHVVRRLLAEGRRVLVTGREPPEPGSELLAEDFQKVSYKSLAGVASVFHLAAVTDTRKPDAEQWQVNSEDAADFLLMCRESDVKRLVYTSSCAVYGRGPTPYGESRDCEPLNAYGAAKLALDKVVSKWAVGLRPTNVFGPGEEHKGSSASFVSQIVAKIRDTEQIKLFSHCSRDLIAVDDVADAIVWGENFPAGVYNVGSGVPVDYLSVAVEAGRLLQLLGSIERVPCPFPFEFQEYTAAQTAKLGRAVAEVGGNWSPKPWRLALADYIRGGWPEPQAV
jgi:ADP-L-glycero-D-manno-heptose 6-epimerase